MVEGNIVVFFGDVHIGNAANHDVVNFFGSIKADDNAHIGKNMVSMFGSVHLGEDVSIGKDLVAMFGAASGRGISERGRRSRGGAGLAVLGAASGPRLVVVWVVREIRIHRRRAYMRYPASAAAIAGTAAAGSHPYGGGGIVP